MKPDPLSGLSRRYADRVSAVAAAPDGAFFVSASWDGTLRIWDARSGAERVTLEGHARGVDACTVSVDGSFIVSGGTPDGALKVWDAGSGETLATIPLLGSVLGVALPPGGDGEARQGAGRAAVLKADSRPAVCREGGKSLDQAWGLRSSKRIVPNQSRFSSSITTSVSRTTARTSAWVVAASSRSRAPVRRLAIPR